MTHPPQAPGVVPGRHPLPDELKTAHDGSTAFVPLLMRSPLISPAAVGMSSEREWAAARKQLRRLAGVVDLASARAGRLPEGPSCAASLILKCPLLLLRNPESLASSHRSLQVIHVLS
jgi:hypothetical protein